MNKRYQVFVSSTYKDLVEERQRITQTLMEMDCIPAGMEHFPAIDQEQFDFIKKVIDDSDYYIILVAGKYGSISPDTGLSYTEMEYDYAVSKGIKIIALVHKDIDSLTKAKTESKTDIAAKLEEFRNKVCNGRLVKFWNSKDEIPGLVSVSLSKTITTFPAIGWVRANTIASSEVLSELNEIRKENQKLSEELKNIRDVEKKVHETIAIMRAYDDSIPIKGPNDSNKEWGQCIVFQYNLLDIFDSLSVTLIDESSSDDIMIDIAFSITNDTKKINSEGPIPINSHNEIVSFFVALDLIEPSKRKHPLNDKMSYFSLTDFGQKVHNFMIRMKLEKKIR